MQSGTTTEGREGMYQQNRYEAGEITLQKMFNEQDRELAEDVFRWFCILFFCLVAFIIFLLFVL